MLKVIDQPQVFAHLPEGAGSLAPGKLPPGCSLSLVTTLRSLLRLETAWRELENKVAAPLSVFQCFDWVLNWSEVYAGPTSENDLCIVVGRRKNEIVFIWPLVRQRRFGIEVLIWAGHPIGQYGDLLIDAAEPIGIWVSVATAYLRHNKIADLLHLRHVRSASNFSPCAAALWNDGKLYEQAPALDLSPFKSDEDYLARYDSQQRKRRKKSQRKMEEALGALTVHRLDSGPEVVKALEQAIAEKLKWLEARGRFNRVLTCPDHLVLMKRLISDETSALRLAVLELSLGGSPAAWEVGFEWHGVHYGYITAHRDGLTDFGIGRLTLDAAQRQALAAGMTEYDLMVPYDAHKESFSSHKVPVNDWFLPISAKGAAYGHLYLGWARPALRRFYMRLPSPVLRGLKKILRQ